MVINNKNFELKNKELLSDIKNILSADTNFDEDVISLYDIAKLIKIKKQNFDKVIAIYLDKFNHDIYDDYNYSNYAFFCNYSNQKLMLGFKYNYKYYFITILKKNNQLYVLREEPRGAENLLFSMLGNNLSMLYDKLIAYSGYYQEHSYNVQSINSNFIIDIGRYGVGLFFKKGDNEIAEEFLMLSPGFLDKYDYEKKLDYEILAALHGREDEIFRKILVKIEDCPKWSRTTLYEIRKKQLNEESIRTKIKKKQ